MAGLFGQKIRDFAQSQKGADYFGALSRGENFGAAMDTANKLARQRILEEQVLKRQQGIDAMDMQYKQAQIDAVRNPRLRPSDFDKKMAHINSLYANDPEKLAAAQDYMFGLSSRPQGVGVFDVGGVPYMRDPTTGTIYPVRLTDGPQGISQPSQQGQSGAQSPTNQGSLDELSPTGQGSQVITSQQVAENEARIAAEKKRAEELAALEVELQSEAPDAYSNMMAALSKVNSVTNKVRDLKSRPNLSRVTGWEAKVPTFLPTTQATEALITELQSGATIQSLIDAKNSGATFGALSDTEIMILRDEIASLNTKMDDESFIKQLDKIISYMDNIETNVRRAYKAKYGKYAVGDLAVPPPAISETPDKKVLKNKYGLDMD